MMEDPLHKYPIDLQNTNHYFLVNHSKASYYLSEIDDKFVIDRITNPDDHYEDQCILFSSYATDDIEYSSNKEGYDLAVAIAKKILVLL